MNKKAQYIDTLKAKIKEVDITQVASLRYDLVKQGNYHKMLCPFHHDSSIGSFVVGGRQNTYFCFTCGEKGDGIHLISHADGTGFVDTVINISEELKFITGEQADSLKHDQYSVFNLSEIADGEFRPFEATDPATTNIAEPDVLNNVFTSFSKGMELIGEARLSQKHYKHLSSVRGLSDQAIEEADFFTFPNPKVLREFYDDLYKEYGYLPTILENVPGFYSATNWKVDTNHVGCAFKDVVEEITVQLYDKQEGIGIPIKDAQGRIVGIQIRADEGNLRYKWFSSANADRHKGKSNPTSSGAPKDVVYPTQLKNTTLFITEGKFKAISLADKFGSVVVSIQGVSSWRGIEELVKEIEEELDVAFNHIVIAYDADLAYNDAVAKQTIALGDALSEATEATIHVAVWDDELGKGIDDLIQNGNIHALSRIVFPMFKEQIKVMFEIKQPSKEQWKSYFMEHVLSPVAS